MQHRLLNYLLAVAIAALPTGLLYGQTVPSKHSKATTFQLPSASVSAGESQSQLKAILEKHPKLRLRQVFHPRHLDFPSASEPLMGRAPKERTGGLLGFNPNTDIWVSLIFRNSWYTDETYSTVKYRYGIYSFNPADSLFFTEESNDFSQPKGMMGVQLKGDHLYTMDFEEGDGSYGLFLNDFNTTTWTSTRTNLGQEDWSLAALATTEDEDGNVFGEFYNHDASAYEWAKVDYSTRSRDSIGPATNQYVVLGITNAGQLYGVADDGNLYKIDKSNGKETLVGATGLTLKNGNGQVWSQSGEIDPKDNTFYWLAVDVNGENGLYTIDLNTGKATKIGNNDGVQSVAMVFPPAPVSQDVPAKVTNASLSFSGTSLSGTVSFTAPTKTYSNESLTGALTYYIIGNSDTLATGSTTAGAAVTANVTVPESGDYTFFITTANSHGSSPKTKLTKYVGFDKPLKATGVTALADGHKVKVTWTKPAGGANNGEIGALTYDVYRNAKSDTTKVGSDIADTTFTDSVPTAQLAYYTYSVNAKAGGLESDTAVSNGVIAGDPIEPDWTNNFDTQSDFGLFSVIDEKGTTTWVYNTSGYAWSDYDWSNGNDDWLITPPLHLTSGRNYTVSFSVSGHTTKFQVMAGASATVEAMTTTLLDTTAVPSEWTKLSYKLSVPKEGNYYIGFHDNNAPQSWTWNVLLDSISVTKDPLLVSPDSVQYLRITPNSRGKLSATVNFNVPNVSINGNYLPTVDSLKIYRDGTLITTLPKKYAGANVSYVDNAVPTNGVHTYEVVPYLNDEFGRSNSASAFIGQDVPENPSVDLMDNETNVLAFWPKVASVGPNGGFVDRDHVAVTLFTIKHSASGYSYVGDSITTSEKGARRVELPQNPEETTVSDGTTQTLYQLAARADGDAGSSETVTTFALVIGPTIQIPFRESHKNGKNAYNFMWTEGNDQYKDRIDAASWSASETSSDDDGGSFIWAPHRGTSGMPYTIEDGDECAINTPKVSVKGATNPKLIFYLNSADNNQAELHVYIATPDGVEHDAAEYDLASVGEGWQAKEIDLSPYTSQRYIIAKFRGVASGSNVSIGVDNINIFDQKENDLAATAITVPEVVTAGKAAAVKVNVENYGSNAAGAYSVVLYNGDNAIDTVNVSDALAPLASDTVSFSVPVKVNQTDSLHFSAKVVFTDDEFLDNNTTDTKVVKVIPSVYPKVTDLAAETSDNDVNLKWTKPTVPKAEKTLEDFESYEPFSTELGEWTLVNRDRGLAGSFFYNYTYPGQGTSFAFDAFNPDAITRDFVVTASTPGVLPHSGSQFAGAPYTINPDNGSRSIDADNWLISPELSGEKQTIKFYALNMVGEGQSYPYYPIYYYENFDVLYSTTENTPDSFKVIESDVADGQNKMTEGVNWKEFSVELPEGAKYFAIHHNTPASSNYLFGIDDVTYDKLAVGANDSITGYNVYRDGVLIGTADADGNLLTFTDDGVDAGSHTYNVTVVFRDKDGNTNESGFSNDASVTVTVVDAISEIPADATGLYNVYTVDGKALRLNAKSLSGLQRGVYVINDKKYVIK